MATKTTNTSKQTNTAPAEEQQAQQTPPAPGLDPQVRVHTIYNTGSTRALCSATLYNAIAIRGIHVVEGKNGLFVQMPSRKTQNGDYRDVVFPVTAETRQQIQQAVLDAYTQQLAQVASQAQNATQPAAAPAPQPALAM